MTKKTRKNSNVASARAANGKTSTGAKRRTPRNKGVAPEWLRAVLNPFSSTAVGIPDEQVMSTCKYKTLATLQFTTSDLATVPSTAHGKVICIAPVLKEATISQGSWNSGGFFGSWGDMISNVPNFGAVFPVGDGPAGITTDSYRYRVVSMAAKLTYIGTELNRSAVVYAGLVEPDAGYTGNINYAAAYCLGSSYAALGNATTTQQAVIDHYKTFEEIRNPDGSILVTSVPSGVPKYIPLSTGGNMPVMSPDVTSRNPLPGIMFVIQGDMTPSASALGNSWELSVVWNTEVVPTSTYVLACSPTPSPYVASELQTCLNSFQSVSPVRVVSSSSGGGVGTIAVQPIQAFESRSGFKEASVAGAAALTALGFMRGRQRRVG